MGVVFFHFLMKSLFFSLFFIFFAVNSFSQQRLSLSAGITFSNVTASSSQTTNIRLASGYRFGFFIGVARDYYINQNTIIQPNIKVLQSGASIHNSYFLTKVKIPDELKEFSSSNYKVMTYRFEFGTDIAYRLQFLRFHTGLSASCLFYGNWSKTSNKKREDTPPSDDGNSQSDNPSTDYNIVNLNAQFGTSFYLNKNLLLDFTYYTNITTPVSLNYNGLSVDFHQNIYQIGISYYIPQKNN